MSSKVKLSKEADQKAARSSLFTATLPWKSWLKT